MLLTTKYKCNLYHTYWKNKIVNGHQGEIVLIANKKGCYGCGEGVKMLFLKQFNLFIGFEADKETSNKKNGGFVDDNI